MLLVNRTTVIAISYLSFLSGCVISPVPNNIEELKRHAQRDYLSIKDVVKPGDIIFRLGNQRVMGGLFNFSKLVADLSSSNFSHASLVISDSCGLLVMDVNIYGVQRKFFRDWHVTGTKNLVVKRLKPEYSFLIPKILETTSKILEDGATYSETFVYTDKAFYCTQLIDYVFRTNDYPLADLVRIQDLPKYGTWHRIACLIGGISPLTEVVIAGNDNIGLFSSGMLETVIDLR